MKDMTTTKQNEAAVNYLSVLLSSKDEKAVLLKLMHEKSVLRCLCVGALLKC